MKREPCFDNMLRVLDRKKPEKPTLFEFFLNVPLYERLAGSDVAASGYFANQYEVCIKAYHKAGYDYTTLLGSDFGFPINDFESKKSRSANSGSIITNRDEFNRYEWPEPSSFDYSRLEKCGEILPDGMKIIVWGPNGVLENVTNLVGYDNLCYMLSEDPGLAADIFDAVGSRLNEYYEICSRYPTVGALISNDDWGFHTQTLLSPKDLRKYVFPYHKRIVRTIHEAGKPAILHSCGQLSEVMDDIIGDMEYDGKHSYEDSILPVEEAYIRYHDKIAVIGGIDLDFICRETPENVEKRCRAMIELTNGCTGYALGTGNSVPEYVPVENYFAMLHACD